jgi:hypothetical protein
MESSLPAASAIDTDETARLDSTFDFLVIEHGLLRQHAAKLRESDLVAARVKRMPVLL